MRSHHRARRRRVARVIASAIIPVILPVILVGCAPQTAPGGSGGDDLPGGASSTAAPTPTVSESPAAGPGLDPDGSAADNLAYFDAVNSDFLAPEPMPGGRAVIDNLVSAGFDKTRMQVTPDSTPTGLRVDSVQFSVRFDDECLIGQASEAGYTSAVGPTVNGTTCLLGITRTIDW